MSEYRQDRNGGGVSIFIKGFIDYKKCSDLTGYNSYMESIFIEISKTSINCNKNVIISVIYRPPGTDNFQLNNNMSNFFSKINMENKII